MKSKANKQVPKAYDHLIIEKKWQKKWAKSKIYRSKEDAEKSKYYVLDMFPYPSGEGLHVGHPKGYIATDVVSRMKRMQGHSVLHPMGFDAFGLPAENYAIKTRTNPLIAVQRNVKRFKEQLEIIGLDYDWTREINTTDPAYYRWTQWIFLQLFKKGLAFESNEPVNWCPTDKTVLANEDVEDGRCERCGTPVEKRPLRQWVLKITDYADRLLNDLDAKKSDGTNLLDWPESIKESQRNWIGKSEGAIIDFPFASTTTENISANYIILHGFEGSAESNFIPWLKSELEKKGHKVTAPELPNAFNPTEDEQVDFVLKNCHFDENTVLIGHSLGAVVAMKVLMKLNEPISGLVIVAAASDPSFFGESAKPRPFHETFKWDFDLDLIKKQANGNIAVLSDTQEEFRAKYLNHLSTQLDARLIEVRAKEEHFCALEEPEILAALHPSVKVFTTRPDTIFGVTYMVLAPEHPYVKSLLPKISNRNEVVEYIEKAKLETEMERTDAKREKTGVELKGIRVVNPANNESVPVWIADYVLADYGTGAVMAVPAHDERDADFAKKYDLPIREIKLEDKDEMIRKFGSKTIKYKLRDWVFSRQRYWGEPMPLIHCANCGVVPVPEKDLPVKLPKVVSYEPTGTGESPLAAIGKWVNVKCPKCKGKSRRETNTMPQWAGSSWYYLRYMDPKNKKALVDSKKEKYWAPVDLYIGGAEHATRHLIYARFWHKFLYDIGVTSTIEPFSRLQSVGLIMGEDGRKMSKRFGNVVNPDEVVARFGADTLRVYEMFMGPFDQQIAWSTDSMVGARRFVEKVWRLSEKVLSSAVDDINIIKIIHKTIKKVTDDINGLKFNTAISSLMIAVNELDRAESISKEQFQLLLQILAPFMPHVADELWSSLGNKKSIHISSWPEFDPKLIEDNEVNIIVQINGKMRGSFMAAKDTSKELLEETAKKVPEVMKWLTGKAIQKIVVVPNRLVSIVVGQ
ncbi:MAG: alpha/beta fold hydrolase [Candidatus Taylorbacteria bacterium]